MCRCGFTHSCAKAGEGGICGISQKSHQPRKPKGKPHLTVCHLLLQSLLMPPTRACPRHTVGLPRTRRRWKKTYVSAGTLNSPSDTVVTLSAGTRLAAKEQGSPSFQTTRPGPQ